MLKAVAHAVAWLLIIVFIILAQPVFILCVVLLAVPILLGLHLCLDSVLHAWRFGAAHGLAAAGAQAAAPACCPPGMLVHNPAWRSRREPRWAVKPDSASRALLVTMRMQGQQRCVSSPAQGCLLTHSRHAQR